MSEPDLPLWEIVQTYHPVARGFYALFAEAGLATTLRRDLAGRPRCLVLRPRN